MSNKQITKLDAGSKPKRYHLTILITANTRDQIAEALAEATAKVLTGVRRLTSENSDKTITSLEIEEYTP